jgi:putative tryptophan/tyrosine transport system substrate-binding protein
MRRPVADEAHYGAVFVVADALLVSEAAQIAKLSLKYQLPSMHQVRAEAEAGGLMSYGPDTTKTVRKAQRGSSRPAQNAM